MGVAARRWHFPDKARGDTDPEMTETLIDTITNPEAIRVAREIATKPDSHFRIPENLVAEKRSLETRLKACRNSITTLTTNMAKAQWTAIAVIVDAIRWGERNSRKRLDLGRPRGSRRGGVAIGADDLFDYVFDADAAKGSFASEITGLINYAVRENIPDVYKWIAENGGRSEAYRKHVAKPQQNPRKPAGAQRSAKARTSHVAASPPPVETISDDPYPGFPKWAADRPYHLIPPDDLDYESDIECECAHDHITDLLAIAFDPKEPESTRITAYRRLFEFVGEADIFVVLNQRQLYAELEIARESELEMEK